MYVVGHETIAQHMDTVFLSKRLKKGQVGFSIFIVQKHVLAVVAPLGNMTGVLISDDSCYSRHKPFLSQK
jgi:hypothetical protein